jgi:hypothetical protein
MNVPSDLEIFFHYVSFDKASLCEQIGEREAYFDSLALVLALLRRPREWAGDLRYRGWLPGG